MTLQDMSRLWLVLTGVVLLVVSGHSALAQTGSSPLLSGPVENMSERRRIQPLPHAQISPETASPDATPAERPMRPFSGWVGPGGCKFVYDGQMWGRVQDGRISGMAAEGHNFDWVLGADKRFAGELRLKSHSDTGAMIMQFIEGRVDRDRIVMDIRFGVPGAPETNCQATGVTLALGGTGDPATR
jgi:hypothetical protein